MKKFLSLTLINLILVIFQSSFLNELLGDSFSPNLVIAFAFSLFIMDRQEHALMSGFIGGILLDLYGFTIVGLSPLIITASMVLFTLVKRYFFRGFTSNLIFLALTEYVYVSLVFGLSGRNVLKLYCVLVTVLAGIFFYLINSRFPDFYAESKQKYSR